MLSIADGMAASFFNTFLKIITPPPFLRAAEFRLQRYEEKPRYVEKIGEIQRKSEKFREKLEIICKFSCISVRIVRFFCSKVPAPSDSFAVL
jgi:hypothetical protein